MEMREFNIENWQNVRDFEENGNVAGTTDNGVQLGYILFLIKEGYESTGKKLLNEVWIKEEPQPCLLCLTIESHAKNL